MYSIATRNTFWSPNLICLLAFLETFMRHKKILFSLPLSWPKIEGAHLPLHPTFDNPLIFTVLQCYLLIAEPHLPPRVSRDIHAAQEDPLLVTVVEDGGTGVLGLKAPHQLGLDWGVILFVDNIIDAVTVNQQVFLQTRTHIQSRQKTHTIRLKLLSERLG